MQGIIVNRDKFWNAYRREFREALYQPTVDGLNGILNFFERETRLDNIPQFSYCLATAYHETGKRNAQNQFIRFQPVREGKAAAGTEVWEKYQSKYWHTGYYGRGLVQTTHRENYLKIGQLVGVGDLFVREPDLLLQLKWSYESMVAGMVFGIYRKDTKGRHTLDRYFPSETATFDDYFQAREIINGDKYRIPKGGTVSNGHHIAVTALKFAKILGETRVPFAALDESEINLEIPAQTEESPAVESAFYPSNNEFIAGNETVVETQTGNSAQIIPSMDSFDAPDNTPQLSENTTLAVEDWKPFCFRWLRRVWGFFTGANFAQIGSLGFAGIKDPANWWLYVGAILFIIFILLIFALLVSGILLVIWYINRKEISGYITMSKQSIISPYLKNLCLEFEKK